LFQLGSLKPIDLTDLGFCFNYGFDIQWDLDPGNLTRCEGIVNLIDNLNEFDARTLISMTQESNLFNHNHVISNQFFKTCETRNHESIARVHTLLT